MKTIGAKNTFILSLFLSEALLIGLLGATSGILIGIGGAYALSSIAPHTNPTTALASAGLQEDAATRKGLHFRINKADTAAWYSSKRIGEKYSGFKVLIEEDTDLILGAHLFGPHAEVINIFAVAIRLELKAADIKQTLFSYPTNSSDISYML